MHTQIHLYDGANEVRLPFTCWESGVDRPQSAANPCHKVVLELSNSEHDAGTFQRLLKRTKSKLRLGKTSTPKILDLVDKASILGVVARGNNMLVVYNGQHLSACMFIF